MKVPLNPHPKGNVRDAYGGPATSAADVLRRARNALSARGAWVRGAFTRDAPQGGAARCAIQAIRDVDGVYANRAEQILLSSIRETNPGSSSIEIWNDKPSRSKHEVLDRFDRAIEIAETQGV